LSLRALPKKPILTEFFRRRADSSAEAAFQAILSFRTQQFMKILITGGAGCIGAILAPQFVGGEA
jgi:hypothetical protein